MMTTLSEKFQASRGKPVVLDGRQIYPIFKLDIEKETVFDLHWKKTNSELKQGIQIKIDKGVIEVNNEKLSNIILWQDTCPENILLRCLPKKKTKLKIWNVWQVDGLIQAWVGNSGIDIEHSEKYKYKLKCSNGDDQPDFNNIILELEQKGP